MLAEHQGLSNKVRSSWQWLTGRSLTFDDPGAGSRHGHRIGSKRRGGRRRLKIATDMSKFRPECENEPGDTVAADTLNEVQMPNAFLCFWLWRRLILFWATRAAAQTVSKSPLELIRYLTYQSDRPFRVATPFPAEGGVCSGNPTMCTTASPLLAPSREGTAEPWSSSWTEAT